MTVNVNAPNGFQEFQLGARGGAPTGGQQGTPVKIAYNNGTAIGYGDPVIQINTGYIGRAASATAVAIKGIFVGCRYVSSSNNQPTFSRYWPGSGNLGTADVQAWILPYASTLFQVQAYNTAISFADIGANISFQIGTVNTTTGFSGAAADQSTVATTNTLSFRVVGLLSQYLPANSLPGTDDASAYNRIIVGAANFDVNQLEGI